MSYEYLGRGDRCKSVMPACRRRTEKWIPASPYSHSSCYLSFLLKDIDDFQNSYEYLGRCRCWGRCGARRACLAGQQWILCLTRLDPALAAIFLVVAFHDGLHTVDLKRLLFLPRPSPRHRGTPGRCWGPRGCQHARSTARRWPHVAGGTPSA